MERKAIQIKISDDKKRIICFDKENVEELNDYINQDERHQKKFQYIASLILRGIRMTELYDKENIDRKTKGVTAMKFFKGQENDRIYCKEFTRDDKTFIVVAAELLTKKKSKDLKQKTKNIIRKVANYEYEIE